MKYAITVLAIIVAAVIITCLCVFMAGVYVTIAILSKGFIALVVIISTVFLIYKLRK